MSGAGRSILLVEDDDRLRQQLATALERRGWAVHQAETMAAATDPLRVPKDLEFAVVDLRLPDGGGLEVLDWLLARSEPPRVLMLTGYGSIATAVEALRRGACDYLTKPADADEILAALTEDADDRPSGADPTPTASLERVEWEHIQRVLNDCSGNVTHAARVLGVHRRTLQRKLSYRPPRH